MTQAEALKAINLHLEKKRRLNRGFSLRVLARELGVAPSFVSAILSGAKPFPEARFQDVVSHLEIDDYTASRIREGLFGETVSQTQILNDDSSENPADLNDYQLLNANDFSLLRNWYLIPLLDLVTTTDFVAQSEWIAKRLSITNLQAELAWKDLVAQGYVAQTESGTWIKVNERIRLASNSSKLEIRNFHSRMLNRAVNELSHRTTDHDFKNREISGLTLAVNPQNIEKARLHLIQALHEVADILTEGECTEVYQLQTQLFPHTSRD